MFHRSINAAILLVLMLGMKVFVSDASSTVITTTSDFQTNGNNEGMVSISGDQIKRDKPQGGEVGSWTTGTTFNTARSGCATVAYNGYLYVVGGGGTGTVEYAVINPGGTVGNWQYTASLTLNPTRNGHTVVAYSGYLYLIGGDIGNVTNFNDVQYARVSEINGSLSAWQKTTQLPSGWQRTRHTSVAYNGFLYLIGGYYNDGSSWDRRSNVFYAPINADGTLGSWFSTTVLPTINQLHSSVAYNGYLYMLGGNPSGSGGITDVYYARINTDGTIGTLWYPTTFLPVGMSGHTTVADSGYLYLSNGASTYYTPINANGTLGAWAATTSSANGGGLVSYKGYCYLVRNSDVQYAAINACGTVGAWTASTTSFTTGRFMHASVAYNGYLYVIGGCNGRDYLNTVEYAVINANGTLTWCGTTASFATVRHGHTSVAYNGYLYVIGGNNGGYLNSVEYAVINADGTLTWRGPTASFTTARYFHTSVAYNGYLYVIGGYNGLDYLNTVEYAVINADGTLTWRGRTASFTTARYGHTSVVYNGYLYVIGGCVGVNTAEYAVINADGTLTWRGRTAGFTTERYYHTSVVYNGYLYVIGGYSGGYLNTVEYVVINADGTLLWRGTTASFTTARYGHTSVVYNGYLYVIGGYSGNNKGGWLSDVQYAPIQAVGDGTVGAFNPTTAFPTARNGHTSVAYNGYLYVLGGNNGLSDVQYAPINGDGTISSGTWLQCSSLNTGRYSHCCAVYNGYLYVASGFNSSGVLLTSLEYAPINADGSLNGWQTDTDSPLPAGRECSRLEAYKGYLYMLGGGDDSNPVRSARIKSDGSIDGS